MNLRKYGSSETRAFAESLFRAIVWLICVWVCSAIAWKMILKWAQSDLIYSMSAVDYLLLKGADPFGVGLAVIGGLILTCIGYGIALLIVELGHALLNQLFRAYRTWSNNQAETKTDCRDADCICGYHCLEQFDAVTQIWSHFCFLRSCTCVRHANKNETFDESIGRWLPCDTPTDPTHFLSAH